MNSRAISLTLAAFVLLACASADSSMSDDTISFSTAQAEVEVQLKAGRSESACYKVASDVKAEVDTACRNAQKMVNDINTGSSCCKTNAGAVTQADSRLKEVQGKLDRCKSALRDAQDTKVSFPAISFKKLKKGKCASFFGGNSYKNAKRKFDNQKRKCNGLQGQVKAFKRGASDAKKAQKTAIQKCLNRRHRTISSTYNTAKKQCNSSANKKTWKRAKHMLCVLKKTPLNKCKVAALPSIKKSKTASINCKGQKFSHGVNKEKKKSEKKKSEKKKSEKIFGNGRGLKHFGNRGPFKGRTLEYLDRQHAKCEADSVIMSAQFRVWGRKARYTGRCRKALQGKVTEMQTKYSKCHTAQRKNLEFLDRQSVKCNGKQALVEFQFGRYGCSGNKMKYKYKCMDIGAKSEKTHYTNCHVAKGKKLEFLDRQTLKCPGQTMAINGFRLSKFNCPGNQMKYRINCVAK